MVLTWILNSITPSIANSLEYYTDLHVVWLDLSSHFSHGNNARIYHLKLALSSLQQTTNSVHDYYNQIKQIWDELGHLQSSTDLKDLQQQADYERMSQFLLALNDSFATLRTQILAMDPLPPISKVFSILFQEDQQRLLNLRSSSSETLAMVVRTTGRPKSPLKCTVCGRDGHTCDHCLTIVGYPPGQEPRTKSCPSILGQPLSPKLYQKLLSLLAPSPLDSLFLCSLCW
ncbi:uncharacterized protein LOC118348024 [Juglans regia]|uniref:Uncharacterized protein LOC118348024 n=1 Tax=Juglans regia TaxID=51240 RepID=A0A6P9EKV3_JUGRE|nr:uncharacterized protein LOC118348024 [Juglans regia]